ncbi:MAG: phospholipase/carboxylesterase, partial [Fimbriimonadaceae bacterium]|nr:phospholipase/carboxylesterase [Fimbriimonadaceae bacterium]
IHRWLPGKSTRVLLALHGTGGDENDLIPLAQSIDPDASIISPRGRVNEDGANRFFRRFSEGVFDQEDMQRQTEGLADFLGKARDEYGFEFTDVVTLGFSNGANMGLSLLLRRPELLSGGIIFRGMVPFEAENVDLSGKRVFLANGRDDPMVPIGNATKLGEMLKKAGADVEQLWIDGGHNLTQEDIAAAKSWLAREGARR